MGLCDRLNRLYDICLLVVLFLTVLISVQDDEKWVVRSRSTQKAITLGCPWKYIPSSLWKSGAGTVAWRNPSWACPSLRVSRCALSNTRSLSLIYIMCNLWYKIEQIMEDYCYLAVSCANSGRNRKNCCQINFKWRKSWTARNCWHRCLCWRFCRTSKGHFVCVSKWHPLFLCGVPPLIAKTLFFCIPLRQRSRCLIFFSSLSYLPYDFVSFLGSSPSKACAWRTSQSSGCYSSPIPCIYIPILHLCLKRIYTSKRLAKAWKFDRVTNF